jgi:hypothetical protein
MLFLLRPRQTYMPYALPRNRLEHEASSRELEQAYASTRGIPSPDPAAAAAAAAGADLPARLRELGELHRSGALSDDEFVAAKAKLLAPADGA